VNSGEAFGHVLRRKRKAAGLTQEQLALTAGVERVFVSWLETGKNQPTFQTIYKLAQALNCAPGSLVDEAAALLDADDSRSS